MDIALYRFDCVVFGFDVYGFVHRNNLCLRSFKRGLFVLQSEDRSHGERHLAHSYLN